MPKVEKIELIRQAVTRHFVDWAYVEADECLLALGEKFKLAVERFVQKRDVQVGVFERFFTELDEDDLLAAAGRQKVEGFGLIENEIEMMRKAALTALGPRSKYLLIAIGAFDEETADYKMWGLRDSFLPKELMWLSLGFEPTDSLNDSLAKYRDGIGRLDPVVAKEALKRLEIINRSRTLAVYGHGRADGSQSLDWFNSIELETPSGFRSMLETSHKRLAGEKPSGQDELEPDEVKPKTDRREVDKIAQLFTAMAIDSLGYDPSALRSPVPREIADLAADMGLDVSEDTVRKYLKLGARYIPDDREPK